MYQEKGKVRGNSSYYLLKMGKEKVSYQPLFHMYLIALHLWWNSCMVWQMQQMVLFKRKYYIIKNRIKKRRGREIINLSAMRLCLRYFSIVIKYKAYISIYTKITWKWDNSNILIIIKTKTLDKFNRKESWEEMRKKDFEDYIFTILAQL